MALQFERHPETNEVVNPPTIDSFERAINDAAAAADEDRLALVYEDYTEARDKLVKRLEKRHGKDDEVVAVEAPPTNPSPTPEAPTGNANPSGQTGQTSGKPGGNS